MSQQQRLPPSARVSVATGEDRLFSSTFFLISFFFFFFWWEWGALLVLM